MSSAMPRSVPGPVPATPVPVPADPYPWPYDGPPDPGRLVLLAAGWDGHWRARVADPAAVSAAIVALADAVHGLGGASVWLSHERPARAAADLPEPAPLRPAVPPVPDGPVAVVTAAGIDGFCGSSLDSTLRRWGRDQVLLVGNGLEAPVHSTMRSANDRGFECLLVHDACGPLTTDTAGGAVSSVTMSGGIFGAVAPLADVLAALAGTSGSNPSPSPTAEAPQEAS